MNPQLDKIIQDNNSMVDYISYVESCIDNGVLPYKFDEWLSV